MDFDFRLQPIAYAEFRNRLSEFDIIEDESTFRGARTFRQYRMGVGLSHFYSVSYRGDEAEVLPPTIEAILAHFGVTAAEWFQAGQDISKKAE